MTEVAGARAPVERPEWVDERHEELDAGFDGAAAASGSSTVDRYALAGGSIELRFASPALRERLTPAFEHLRAPARRAAPEPDLTVYLWDSASTGVDAPSRPTVPSDHAPGALFHVDRPPLRAAYQPGLETLSVLDMDARKAWHWVADAYTQPYWDQASPIRQVLFWWLESRGCLQVHGGAIGTEAGGVLLVGKGGSGKSTVALSSLRSELRYAGDDYVAVRGEPQPWVYSLYNSGKLEPHHVRGPLSHLVPLLSNEEKLHDEKAVLYVQQHFPEATISGFPLRAILVPAVRPQGEHRIVETSPAEAFAALAPSTILQLHTAGPGAFSEMSRLVGTIPCFRFEVGADVASIPATVADFLRRLPSE